MQSSADQSLALLAAIVDSSDDAIISKDLDGIITSWNQGAERIFGYAPKEVIGRPVTMLIPSDRVEEEPKILEQIRKGLRITHYETIRRTKQGALLNISLTISPIFSPQGRIIGASKIARDITERKQAEESLAQARMQLQSYAEGLEKLVRERTQTLDKTVAELEAFSYSLSHDLRAPLHTIESFSETVLTDYGAKLGAEGTDLLKRTIKSAQRMDKMIKDLLVFSQLAPALASLEPVNTERLVGSLIQERVEFQPSTAEIKVDSPLLGMQGNESSLTQCITNLLENAVKFVPPGAKPRVRIYTERNEGKVRLWVEDNGIGIAPEDRRQLFQMFQRIHPNNYPGTGLGLAIVRKAIQRMGGESGVESQPGRGSRFWLQLPAAVFR
jgi:PAS domain S-box-containing protein